jgi:hypothetical protein
MSLFSDVHHIAVSQNAIALALAALRVQLDKQTDLLERIAEGVNPKVVGIVAVPQPPHPRESFIMAKMQCKLEKSTGLKSAGQVRKAKAGDPVPSLVLLDTQDGAFTIFGVNHVGDKMDISGVATLGDVASDNPAVLTVDAPAGMTAQTHGLTAGTANVTVTATWNDGSVGPFTITIPATVSTDPTVTGLAVEFGPPTVR